MGVFLTMLMYSRLDRHLKHAISKVLILLALTERVSNDDVYAQHVSCRMLVSKTVSERLHQLLFQLDYWTVILACRICFLSFQMRM